MEGIQKDYQKDIKKIIFLAPSGVEKTSFIRKVIKNFEETDFDLKKMNIILYIMEKKLKFLYSIYLQIILTFQYIKSL